MIKHIKKFLRNNSLTANSYKKLRSYLADRKLKKRNQKVKRYGEKTVHLLQEILTDCKVKFFFDMGTLLGIIREGHLLSYDFDIDVAVYVNYDKSVENLRDSLVKKGCKHSMRLENSEIGVIEDTFVLNDIKFDVSYYFIENDIDVCYLGYYNPDKKFDNETMDLVRLECNHIDKTEGFYFGGVQVNVPEKSEEYLAQRYGESWRIPDKNYVYWKGPSTKKVPYTAKRTVINQTWIIRN